MERWTTQWGWVEVLDQAASVGMVARMAVHIPTAVLTHRRIVVESRMPVGRTPAAEQLRTAARTRTQAPLFATLPAVVVTRTTLVRLRMHS